MSPALPRSVPLSVAAAGGRVHVRYGCSAAALRAALQDIFARDPNIGPAPGAACLARNAAVEEARAPAACGEQAPTVTQIVRRRSMQDGCTAAGSPDFGCDLLTV